MSNEAAVSSSRERYPRVQLKFNQLHCIIFVFTISRQIHFAEAFAQRPTPWKRERVQCVRVCLSIINHILWLYFNWITIYSKLCITLIFTVIKSQFKFEQRKIDQVFLKRVVWFTDVQKNSNKSSLTTVELKIFHWFEGRKKTAQKWLEKVWQMKKLIFQ